MNTELWGKMLLSFANLLKENSSLLCEIDGVTGDGDHGITMSKIAECIERRINSCTENDSIKKINEDLGIDFMNVNGGSAGPLFGTIFEGMAEGIEHKREITIDEVKNMFKSCKEEFQLISKAKEGDKTLVDALYPAIDAIINCENNLREILKVAYEKAEKGSENTEKYRARFGRAKNIGDRSIGHRDPGSVSIALMFKAFSESID